MMRYREFDVDAPDYQPMTFYSSDAEERPGRVAVEHPRQLRRDQRLRTAPAESPVAVLEDAPAEQAT